MTSRAPSRYGPAVARLDVPDWITVRPGRAPILLIAPHGGRRYDPRHPGKHKVNDLHTPELTHELASRLDATAVINAAIDRNEIDLNRLTQVRTGAPWLLPVLAEMLGTMLAEHGRATVLVIHGWNVTQAVCDVGVGMREGPEGPVAVREDTATVSEGFLRERVRPLQQAAAAAGIAVTLGSRYPAAHPNNLLQAFRAAADRDGALGCPVAALCRTAGIEAVQLELGIPLRWPGTRRARFAELVIEAFQPDKARPGARADERATLALGGGRLVRRAGMQFVAGDLVVLTGIDASEHGPIAGRLLVSRGAHRLALFTGELHDASQPWTVPPLACQLLADGVLRMTYRGPLLEFGALTPFLDLERGLAGGTLVEAVVDLTFRPDPTALSDPAHDGFGSVTGVVAIDGVPVTIETVALAGRAVPHLPRALPSLRVVLPASAWGPLVLTEDPTAPLTPRGASSFVGRLVTGQHATAIAAACEVVLTPPSGRLALAIEGPTGGGRLVATLERLIPVRRPGRGDGVVETTYATLHAEGACVGWAELTRLETSDQAPAETAPTVSRA